MSQQGPVGLARARGVLASPGSVEPRERIFVREHNSVVPVALADIHRIEGQDDYCMLHSDRNHLVNLRLRDLEAWLPNPPFIRVHRSHIVNLDYVERLAGLDDSRFEVIMRDARHFQHEAGGHRRGVVGETAGRRHTGVPQPRFVVSAVSAPT